MPRALIVGGTGMIGRATAGRLLAAGWQVDLTGRDRAHLPADVGSCYTNFADIVTSANFIEMLKAGKYRGIDSRKISRLMMNIF